MDAYSPPPNLSLNEIPGEIGFITALLDSLDPNDPKYDFLFAKYSQQIQALDARLGQPVASNSSYSPPGNGYASAPTPESSDFRKHGRDAISYEEAPSLVAHGIPLRLPSREYSQYYTDLTGPDPSLGLGMGLGFDSVADPFAELESYQPDQPQPCEIFNQDWMDDDQLAQFLAAPSNMQASPAYQPKGISPRNQTLEEELFGDMPDPAAVQGLIENIQFDQEVQPEEREQTPIKMASTLMEHQKIALTWLLKMERSSSKGGILADEMGLGKTVEALSLMLANPSRDPTCKTTLIVAPVALIRQWEKEIERHVKPHHRLKVYNCHQAGKRGASFDKLRTYDVVMTTYGTLASEFKQKDNRQNQEDRANELQPSKRRAAQTLPMLGTQSKWYRVILDEAQYIKNRKTWSSRAADNLVSQYRWCLTGTPMQNNVEELYSLVRFLKLSPYMSWTRFNDDISKPLRDKSSGMRNRGMQCAQGILRASMLRRGKNTLVDGKKISEMPPKKYSAQHVEFSDAEDELYKAIETKNQIQFNKYLKKGTVNNNYACVLVMLLRLRQICCHPHLVNDLGIQVSTEGIDEVDLKQRAGLLSHDVVNRLREIDGFECPICLEVEANPTVFIPCGHTCCGECFQKLINESTETAGSAKCPHCRGTLSSDNITDFKHFCKVHCPEKLVEFGYVDDAEDDRESEGGDDDISDDSDEETDNKGNIKGFVVSDDEYSEDESQDSGSATNDDTAKSRDKGKGKAKGKGKEKTKVTMAQLKKQSLRSKAMKKKYLKRLRKNFQSSAKIDKTMELLSEIKANDPTEKTLIFSQWTTLLDLLEVPLSERGIKYQRYDGSMSISDRSEAVNTFMETSTETVFLISLKAGNAGLNLNKASQVIILDPFWNPFVEDQAVDRAHRMPQKREVKVHRVLVPETVEDRICSLQDKKRELINMALDEGVGKSLTRLSVGELQYLFGLRERD
ncbi:hypothetical protein P280DRAFT_456301 [Massarina eburnea CBS 473.64]|uniref:Uncharacterized protein n=1 Tax=Massarina eburnea CBS 473.64 TaxID=1395130 RepID=A0A6A6RVB8_9PLEO|nr:hypothetical protein P280DRAFT_456301 [Massarina eburnea CBS 473.64]